ncbi:YceI family protein [Leptospira ognonensis]|uniref:YceI family protein n=1 Tax=Leptospira ognonensis TaxID=2484945 RepID=A0A4V3JQM4_9LEPT|nr:YceI family protein [Leptospira ognonensis]TGL56315.1 YceI family protein [Leptospira ognonensis]
MKNIIPFALLLSFFLLGNSLAAEEKCEYDYDSSKTTLEWTAFKFTEKTGVKGSIQKVDVKKTKRSSSVIETLKNLKFVAFSDSVNSNNPDRDAKIKTYFFGSVKEIKGHFTNIVVSPTGGTAVLKLELNKKKESIPVTYTISENTVILKGTLDVLKFGMGSGIQKLNEVCSDLHKGADGKSILWPTVDFQVTSTLLKECKP